MLRRASLVGVLAVLATLVGVSSARGDGAFFIVTTTADGGGTCTPYPQLPGGFTCPTLRSAVAAASDDDVIFLQQAATYTLTLGAIDLTRDVTIVGPNALTTTIDANHASRAFTVDGGVQAGLYGLTVANGQVAGDGGNILNQGDLALSYVRVTGGTATNGGGIDNAGTLELFGSLLDANRAPSGLGGAIYSTGDVTLLNSTVFNNDAGQVGGIVALAGTVEVDYSTVALNTSSQTPTGILTNSPWTASGSLFAQNFGDGSALSNCGNAASSAVASIEDSTGCGVTGSNPTAIALSHTLTTDDGGQTGYLPIPPTSAAKRFVASCADPVDQRDAPRNPGGTCDAGAYEQGAVAPAVNNPSIPAIPVTPPPVPTATPAPAPTATPAPTPVPGQSVVGGRVDGTVTVKVPGSNRFVTVGPGQSIPLGSVVDTRDGKVQITAAAGSVAQFYDGLFKLTQSKGVTLLTLVEQLAPCGKKKTASAAAKKPKTRKLWGNGSGAFSTRGQYSAATVRGTVWLVQDSCSGTLTKVVKGVVSVRDNVKNKTIIVRARHSYTARPKR